MNIDNLKIYYNWCLDNLLGKIDKDAFNMGSFCNGDTTSKNAKAICGTTACLLGYAPLCFGIKESDYDPHHTEFDYDLFCQRIFDGSWCRNLSLHFIFSDGWQDEDNTLEGAIKRLKYVLDGNETLNIHENYYDKTLYQNVVLNYV